jgi:hypothetical protein
MEMEESSNNDLLSTYVYIVLERILVSKDYRKQRKMKSQALAFRTKRFVMHVERLDLSVVSKLFGVNLRCSQR